MSKKKPAHPPAVPVVEYVQPPLNLALHAHLRQGYSQRGRLVGDATFGTRAPLSTPAPIAPAPKPAEAAPHPLLVATKEPKRRIGKLARQLLRSAYHAANAGQIERAEALIAAAEVEIEAHQ